LLNSLIVWAISNSRLRVSLNQMIIPLLVTNLIVSALTLIAWVISTCPRLPRPRQKGCLARVVAANEQRRAVGGNTSKWRL
jgi:hypothetical protein